MKTLIISDTHLRHTFSESLFLFLKNLISECDKLIINGDLWDGYDTTFDKFITSKWAELFPLMKSKDAIYIFGNHDKEIWSDNRVSLFSVKTAYEQKMTLPNGKRILIQHGDFSLPRYKQLYEKSRFLLRVFSIPYAPLIWLEAWLTKKYGRDREKYIFWEARVEANEKLKDSIDLSKPQYDLYIFSHTHLAEENLAARYINTGVIRFGLASYVVIDDNDINLIKTSY